MIYLTNDTLDQAVYFDLRSTEPHRKGKMVERVYTGLLGNGIHEVPVTLKKYRGSVEVCFGKSELFCYVEQDSLRRMLAEALKSKSVH